MSRFRLRAYHPVTPARALALALVLVLVLVRVRVLVLVLMRVLVLVLARVLVLVLVLAPARRTQSWSPRSQTKDEHAHEDAGDRPAGMEDDDTLNCMRRAPRLHPTIAPRSPLAPAHARARWRSPGGDLPPSWNESALRA